MKMKKPLEQLIKELQSKASLSQDFIDGFWSGVRAMETLSIPKPHVAEVVKCGWYNANKQSLIDNFNQECVEAGMASSPQIILDMVTKCDHNHGQNEPSKNGYVCPRCGEWVNYSKD